MRHFLLKVSSTVAEIFIWALKLLLEPVWTLRMTRQKAQTRKAWSSFSLKLTTIIIIMPPRRAPSQASAAPSRPASPDVDFDDVIAVHFFSSSSVLTSPKRVQPLILSTNSSSTYVDSPSHYNRAVNKDLIQGINVQDILKLKVSFPSLPSFFSAHRRVDTACSLQQLIPSPE